MNIVIRNKSWLRNSLAMMLVHDYYFGYARQAIEKAKELKVNIHKDERFGKKTVIFTVYDQEDEQFET